MKTKYVAVMPWIYKPYYEACVKTMHPEFRENVLFVDNTVNNLGIMRSHNLGIEKMRNAGADWLIILSAAIRFGASGGLDFIKVLQDHPDYYVVHAGTPNSPVVADNKSAPHQEDQEYRNGVLGWHMTAFHRTLFDNIGEFDENLWPYGWDDIDLSIRIQQHYKGREGWGTFPVDVSDTTMAHSLELAGVRPDAPPQIDYMIKKWGRHPSDYKKKSYERPFNDAANGLDFWPKPPDKRAINHMGWDMK